MLETTTISREEPERYGLSYEELRDDGIRIVQEIAGEIWTDYNEHDPGVTILEQLCYAITELTYRLGLPTASLVAGPRGVIQAPRQALFPARAAFPSSPLTVSDYRRLLADRVRAVGNVWLVPVRGSDERGRDVMNGLYDIFVHAPGAWEREGTQNDVREQVLRVYSQHRNLCEDVNRIVVLEPVDTIVSAQISIDGKSAPEVVVAELLFNAALALAPEIRREPLDAQLARGLSPSAIFEGPLLEDGFVSDAELGPRPTRIRIPDLARALARTSGVVAIRDLALFVANGAEARGQDAVEVPADGILVVNAAMSHIEVLRRGAPCRLDSERVQRELDGRMAALRRRYALTPQYDHAFPTPRGEAHDLGGYTSIRHQFPIAYGVGEHGVPDDPTDGRIAQARQLGGYLAVFEQLLAGGFAQIGRARDLFSTARDTGQTYFHPSLLPSVPGAGDLLDQGYEQRLEEALRGADPGAERRNRFLDVLLAMHGDGVSPSEIASPYGREPSAEDLASVKIALLQRLIVAARNRGRGLDYMTPLRHHEPAGMEIRSRIELGLPLHDDHRHEESSGQGAGAEEEAAGVIEDDMIVEDRAEVDVEPPPPFGPPKLHVVEHILLRHAVEGYDEQKSGARPLFAYAFTVTAVVSRAPGPARDEPFERLAKEVLRRNAPAHVAVDVCFLRAKEMRAFERANARFREALANGDPSAQAAAAGKLRRLLERWKHAS